MKVSFKNYQRCIKNFSPLKITPQGRNNDKKQDYLLFDGDKSLVGSFAYTKGHVTDLKLSNEIRRTKTSANAIITIKNFVLQKAQEEGRDYIFFEANFGNKAFLAVKRLYEKIGAKIVSIDDNCVYFVGILNPGKEKEIMDKYHQLPIVLLKEQASLITSA